MPGHQLIVASRFSELVKPTANGRGRLEHLDGLRGWAALAVVLTHLDTALNPTLLNPAAPTWVDSVSAFAFDGPLAVSVFFVLSAIVLASAVDRASGRSRPSFFGLVVKRYLRLTLPMAAGCLLGYLALSAFGAAELRQLATATGSVWIGNIASCAAIQTPSFMGAMAEAFYSSFTAKQPCYDWVLWTIRVEFIGSLAVFALTLVTPVKAFRAAACLTFLVYVGHTYFGCFMIGLLIHDLGFASGTRLRARVADGIGIGLVTVGLMAWSLADMVPVLGGLFDLAAAGLAEVGWAGIPQLIQAPLIVFGCCLSPRLRALLYAVPSRFLGRISFPLYLSHLPLMMATVFPSFLLLTGLGLDGDLAALAVTVVGTPLFLAVAAPFTIWIEQPAVRFAARAGMAVDRQWHAVRDNAMRLKSRRVPSE